MAKFTQKSIAAIALFSIVISGFGASFSVVQAEEVVVESVVADPVIEEVVEEVVEEPAPVVETPVEEVVEDPALVIEEVVEEVVEETPTTTPEVLVEVPVVEETPLDEGFTPEVSLFRLFSENTISEDVSVCLDELDGDWSDNVVSTDQAKRKDGSDVLPTRSVAEAALTNMPIVDSTGFYSLGFGGSMIVSFDKYVVNFVLGTDLTVYETTNLPYPTETAMVEVSQDGVTWVFAGLAVDAGGNYFDFDSIGLDWIKFVRITDTSDAELFPNDADGFDVSAVLSRQSVCELPQEPTYTIGGYKWNDLNADGVWNENEPKLAGWTIVATKNEGTTTPAVLEDVTDEYGYYSIEVPAGSWIITEINQKGWEQTVPNDPEYCSVTVGEEIVDAKVTSAECNFGNHEIVVPQCVADLNLIQNGSFETPDLPEDGFGWDIFESTINGLAWVVEWLNLSEGSPVPAELELQSGFYAASHGAQYAELDSNWNAAPGGPYFGEDTRVRVYQELTTVPGATYTVSYDFSALPRHNAATNILSVLLDGVEVANHSADGSALTNTSWQTYSYSFVATSTSSIIGFADAGLADSFGTLLDNVTVECVPTVIEEEEEVPSSSSSSRGSRGKRAVPTVAGDSISVADPAPLVLGEQVSVVPYGAPGTGHGGTSSQANVLTISQLLLSPRGLRLVK